jgi:hypothetical protein
MKINLILTLLIAATFTGCIYEDGPKFSLLTKKARLSGEWVIESVKYNTTDVTSTYVSAIGANYVMEIEKDGKYRTEGANPDTGTWTLGEDKDDVRFLSDQSGSTEMSYRILKLQSKELWLKYTETNGDILEVQYKSK